MRHQPDELTEFQHAGEHLNKPGEHHGGKDVFHPVALREADDDYRHGARCA